MRGAFLARQVQMEPVLRVQPKLSYTGQLWPQPSSCELGWSQALYGYTLHSQNHFFSRFEEEHFVPQSFSGLSPQPRSSQTRRAITATATQPPCYLSSPHAYSFLRKGSN